MGVNNPYFFCVKHYYANIMSDLEKQAIEEFGAGVVRMVIQAAELADPDMAWATFNDMGMFEHADCVEFLYFE
jgi:hypothetical protein